MDESGQRAVDPPWYRDGLHFECIRCGGCCRGAGTVRLSDTEIGALARRLEMSDPEFRAAYTRGLRGGEVALREKRNRDCVFYDGGCTVYQARPRQCRSWPFWRAVVASRERWAEEATDCPGMNRGALHDAPAIAALARDDGTSGGIPD